MQMMSFVILNPYYYLFFSLLRQKDKGCWSPSMFDMFAEVEGSHVSIVPEPDGVEWDRRFKLTKEYEVLGICVSDHPPSGYEYASLLQDYALCRN